MAIPNITTNRLIIIEGLTVDIFTDDLNAEAVDASGNPVPPENIVFTIEFESAAALAGEFQLTGVDGTQAVTEFTLADVENERVSFQHDRSNNAPSYSVVATAIADGIEESTQAVPAVVTFTPTNDAPTFALNTLTIAEGETVTLSDENLQATDEPGESTAAELTYTIKSVSSNGQFLRVEDGVVTPLVADAAEPPGEDPVPDPNSTFTQADVNAGLIQFQHDGSETPPSYTLTLTDGGVDGTGPLTDPITTNPRTVNIPAGGFIPVNDDPVITKSTISLTEDTTIEIGTNNINAEDIDESNEDNLIFTVTSVTNGRFERVEEDGSITVLASPTTTPVTFTRGEIFAGSIQFVNEPGTNEPPTFSLKVEDTADPAGFDVKEGTVIFQSVNDTPTLETLAIDIEEGEQITLSPDNLFVQDEESEAADLTYTITEIGGVPQIQASSFIRLADATPVQSFTQAEIDAGEIAYQHNGSTTPPSFSLTVTDAGGKSIIIDSGAGLTFGPINDEPQLVRAQLAITEGGTVRLTSAENLLYIDEESLAGQLVYTVTIDNSDRDQPDSFIIAGEPQTGSTVTFTQAQVGAGQVQFVHGGSNLAPNLTITLTDEATGQGEDVPPEQQANTIPVDLAVSFTATNDEPRFLVNTLTIAEGDTVILNAASLNLEATDEETPDSELVYTIDSFQSGVFQRIDTAEVMDLGSGDTFTQGDVDAGFIQFQHDGGELPPDYRLIVTDTGINDDPDTVLSVPRSVTIPPDGFIPVNDDPTFENNTLSLTEGDAFFLTLGDISATDPEDNDSDLVFTVTAVTNGRFERVIGDAEPVVLAAPDLETPVPFTQAEIEAGQIRFVNDPATDVDPTYTIQVQDLDTEDPGITIAEGNVDFEPENDDPELQTLAFTLTEGDTVPLTADVLAVVDEETPPEGINYTVDAVSGGSFVFVDGGAPADEFTQADINAGNVVEFQHDGLNDAPTFILTVSDGVDELTLTETLDEGVTFTPTNDEPEIEFSTFTVGEGASVVLSGIDNLKTVDEESASSALVYTVQIDNTGLDEPDGFLVAGELFTGPEVTFTQAQVNAGQVSYVQGGSNAVANLSMTVTDEAVGEDPANTITVPLVVIFNADNDEPNFITNTLTIAEGGTVVLNSAGVNLEAEDEESSPEALTYSIESVSNGEFQRLDDPENPTPIALEGTFTQAEVDAGLIQFQHDGGEAAPDYTLSLSDAGINGDPDTIERVSRSLLIPEGGFTNVNDAPVFDQNTLTLNEGDAPFLTLDNLSASDVEDDDAALVFTVTSVTNGRFERVVAGAEPEILASPDLETPVPFTQAEIAAGQIRFVNDPATDESPTYTVQVQDLDTEDPGITTDTANVIFFEENDPPVLETLSLNLTEGDTVPLTTEVLSVVDEEALPENITYTVNTVSGGSFVFAADGTPADEFTQADLIAGNVVELQHDGGNNAPTFSLIVSDGENEITVTSDQGDGVTFTPTNDEPVVEANTFEVVEGDSVPLTPAILKVTDEESLPEELVYTVTINNVDPDNPDGFQIGDEFLTGPEVTFTQADVNAGLVTFVHGGSNFAPDVSATVTDTFPEEFGGPTTIDVGLTVGFNAENDPLTVVNNALVIAEDETLDLTPDILLTEDEETPPENLTYTVNTVTNGSFQRIDSETEVVTEILPTETFTQAEINAGTIQFVHNGGEAAPSYNLTVTDTPLIPDGPVNEVTFDAVIPEGGFTNVNDPPTFENNTLEISEGGMVTFSATQLSVSDPDSVLSQLKFSISDINGGTFFLNGDELTPETIFTGAAIAFGELTFEDDGDELPPSYTVTVSDGEDVVTEPAIVVFNEVNDPPEITENFFTIKEGGRLTLNDPLTPNIINLAATDSETPNDLLYEVSEVVGGGFFKFVNFESEPISTFTQQELEDGDISFLHDGTETVPSFQIKVTDPEDAAAIADADVTFIPVNDPPTLETAQLTVTEGVPQTLTTDDLFASDTDSAAADLTFTITNLEGGNFILVDEVAENISGVFSGSLELSEAEVATALADGLYINLHTQQFPGGELRGQINLEAEGVLATGALEEAQEVDPVPDTAATGEFSAILNGTTLQITGSYSGLTSPLQPVGGVDEAGNPESAIHVHVGEAGVNGPILQNLLVDETVPGTGETLTSFTQAQVEAGQIQFIDDGDETPASFTVTVKDQDGAADDAKDVIVALNRVNDDPAITVNTFKITEGATLTLNDPAGGTINLQAEDEETPAAELTFFVSGVNGGEFFNTQTEQTIQSFTQAELDQGLVQFIHDDTETEPAFDLTVKDAEDGEATAAAVIEFETVNDPPTLENGQFTVTEGAATVLSTDDFLAADPDTPPEALVFNITDLEGGEFTGGVTSFTQAQIAAGEIEFIDDGDQEPPTFNVSVSDGEFETDPVPGVVSDFINTNDPPIATPDSGEGFSTDEVSAFTTASVLANDEDPDPDDTLTVTQINNQPVSAGEVELASGALVSFAGTGTFAYDPNGQFIGLTEGQTSTDTFTYTVSDAEGATATATVSIEIAGVNDAPTLETNRLVISRGQTLALSSNYILATDPDSAPNELVFSVSDVTGGEFRLNGEETESFTQQDILSGAVSFVQNGSTTAPSYSLAVSDGFASLDPAEVDVERFIPVNIGAINGGIFDYEQFLQFRNLDAAIPGDEISSLPLAQLFDEEYYRNLYPDVVRAIAAGDVTSGYDHFVRFGINEGRNPSPLYNESFYLSVYDDVAQAVAAGRLNSGLEHFLTDGAEELRTPSPFFNHTTYLDTNDDVLAAVRDGLFNNGFEHYIQFGAEELRDPQLFLYNEAYYLETNPDIARAVAAGTFTDGFQHFVSFGQSEGRAPSILYDEDSYLALNPDVQRAVTRGELPSGFSHYVQFGRFEGRDVFA